MWTCKADKRTGCFEYDIAGSATAAVVDRILRNLITIEKRGETKYVSKQTVTQWQG